MKNEMSIVAPLSVDEAVSLAAHVTSKRGDTSEVTQSLARRGMLGKVGDALVTSPEGLAALLDTVSIEAVTVGTP